MSGINMYKISFSEIGQNNGERNYSGKYNIFKNDAQLCKNFILLLDHEFSAF